MSTDEHTYNTLLDRDDWRDLIDLVHDAGDRDAEAIVTRSERDALTSGHDSLFLSSLALYAWAGLGERERASDEMIWGEIRGALSGGRARLARCLVPCLRDQGAKDADYHMIRAHESAHQPDEIPCDDLLRELFDEGESSSVAS